MYENSYLQEMNLRLGPFYKFTDNVKLPIKILYQFILTYSSENILASHHIYQWQVIFSDQLSFRMLSSMGLHIPNVLNAKFHALTPNTITIYVLFLIDFFSQQNEKTKKKKRKERKKNVVIC